jgi:hypothetical protein
MSEKENLEAAPAEEVVEEVTPVAEEAKPEAVVEEPAKEEPVIEAKPEVVEEKPAKKAKKEEVAEDDKVAIYSSRPVLWDGVGRIERGYNIVSKAQADKWIKRNHVRLATPEEIKGALGN